MSTCRQFHQSPHINPYTTRKIDINGPTYRKLVDECGPPREIYVPISSCENLLKNQPNISPNSPYHISIRKYPQFQGNLPMIPSPKPLPSKRLPTPSKQYNKESLLNLNVEELIDIYSKDTTVHNLLNNKDFLEELRSKYALCNINNFEDFITEYTNLNKQKYSSSYYTLCLVKHHLTDTDPSFILKLLDEISQLPNQETRIKEDTIIRIRKYLEYMLPYKGNGQLLFSILNAIGNIRSYEEMAKRALEGNHDELTFELINLGYQYENKNIYIPMIIESYNLGRDVILLHLLEQIPDEKISSLLTSLKEISLDDVEIIPTILNYAVQTSNQNLINSLRSLMK